MTHPLFFGLLKDCASTSAPPSQDYNAPLRTDVGMVPWWYVGKGGSTLHTASRPLSLRPHVYLKGGFGYVQPQPTHTRTLISSQIQPWQISTTPTCLIALCAIVISRVMKLGRSTFSCRPITRSVTLAIAASLTRTPCVMYVSFSYVFLLRY